MFAGKTVTPEQFEIFGFLRRLATELGRDR
jgi:hypothetical protein